MNETTYRLTPMTAEHLEQVAAIERECFSTPWTAEMLREELFNPAASYIVAEAPDGTVLGYGGLQAVIDEGYITNIAVRGDYRQMGVGSALLEVFCRFGEAHLAFLTLEVRASNQAAIGLYLKHGFAQVGRRKDYYDRPKEDAILMTKEFYHDQQDADQT
jgi:ribosomal-protein-alanine N-acetyltransferase